MDSRSCGFIWLTCSSASAESTGRCARSDSRVGGNRSRQRAEEQNPLWAFRANACHGTQLKQQTKKRWTGSRCFCNHLTVHFLIRCRCTKKIKYLWALVVPEGFIVYIYFNGFDLLVFICFCFFTVCRRLYSIFYLVQFAPNSFVY